MSSEAKTRLNNHQITCTGFIMAPPDRGQNNMQNKKKKKTFQTSET